MISFTMRLIKPRQLSILIKPQSWLSEIQLLPETGVLVRRASNKAALLHKINDPLLIEDVKDKKLKKGEVRYLSTLS